MLRAMTATLYAVPASPPCATVERALGLKGVGFERVDLVPGLHKLVMRARFGAPTVPGLALADGRRLAGSRTILRALDELVPEPPLLPAEQQPRADALRAEEWGDQVLQPIVRRVLWFALSERPDAQLSYAAGGRLRPPVPDAVARRSAPAVARLERRLNDATVPAVRADLLHLPGHLDRVDGWLEAGTLDGDPAPSAADLQIAAGLRLLATLDDIAPGLDARPAGAFARRVFPHFPGTTPRGALPASWVPSALS